MPILTVRVSTAPSAEMSEAIASGLVEVTARVLRKNPSVTAVAIDYTPPEHWIVGGKSLAQHGKASFWLDIKVVEGTNTKDEKAQYLFEIFALMGRILGELHAESYAFVHEVRADAYGFGGITQEHRYIAGKLQDRLAA
jgi:4-oxalocrotonate tautomerase